MPVLMPYMNEWEENAVDRTCSCLDGISQAVYRRKDAVVSRWKFRKVEDPSEQAIRRRLYRMGRKLVDIEGDGNCFFRAVSQMLYGHQGDHSMLRERAMTHMTQNGDMYRPFLPDCTLEEYCDKMLHDGTWADGLAIAATARVTGCRFLLVGDRSDQKLTVVGPEEVPHPRDVVLGYFVDRHFVATCLRRRSSKHRSPAAHVAVSSSEVVITADVNNNVIGDGVFDPMTRLRVTPMPTVTPMPRATEAAFVAYNRRLLPGGILDYLRKDLGSPGRALLVWRQLQAVVPAPPCSGGLEVITAWRQAVSTVANKPHMPLASPGWRAAERRHSWAAVNLLTARVRSSLHVMLLFQWQMQDGRRGFWLFYGVWSLQRAAVVMLPPHGYLAAISAGLPQVNAASPQSNVLSQAIVSSQLMMPPQATVTSQAIMPPQATVTSQALMMLPPAILPSQAIMMPSQATVPPQAHVPPQPPANVPPQPPASVPPGQQTSVTPEVIVPPLAHVAANVMLPPYGMALPVDSLVSYRGAGDKPEGTRYTRDSKAHSKTYCRPLARYLGGVVALRGDHYRLVNGFSNVYFGWGAEDDDFYARFVTLHIPISRYAGWVGTYRSLSHTQSITGMDRYHWLMNISHPMEEDGLSTIKYKLLASEARPLYTYYRVHLNMAEIREPFQKRLVTRGP